MTYFFSSAFLFLILALQTSHNHVSLSRTLGLLADEPAAAALEEWWAGGRGGLQQTISSGDRARCNFTEKLPSPPAIEEIDVHDATDHAFFRSKRNKTEKHYVGNWFSPDWNRSSGATDVVMGIAHDELTHNARVSADCWSDVKARRLRAHCCHKLVVDLGGQEQVQFHCKDSRTRFDRYILSTNGIHQVDTSGGCRRARARCSCGPECRRLLEALPPLPPGGDCCVSSPLASLTPFNRGVSLFARYHACVCGCNRNALPRFPLHPA